MPRFIWRDTETNALLGPYPAVLRTPGLYPIWSQLTTAFKTLGVPPTAREVAILTVGAKFRAAFELYAHEHIALHDTSLTQAQIDDIKAERQPQGLDEQGIVAWKVARELVEGGKPLGKDKWDEAVRVFGEQGALGLLHYTGFYCYACVILNGVDAPVPEGAGWKM